MARPLLSFDAGQSYRDGIRRNMPTPPWQMNQMNGPNQGPNIFPIPPRNISGILNTPPGRNNTQNNDSPRSLLDGLSLGGRRSWDGPQKIIEPPSLLGNVMQPPKRGRNNMGYNNQSNFSSRQDKNRPRKASPPTPTSNRRQYSSPAPQKQTSNSIEQRAINAPLSTAFFNMIKPNTVSQVATNIALDFARREYYGNKGMPIPTGKPSGVGHHTCVLCKLNFLTREKLENHYESAGHKELDDMFEIKKVQARLVTQNKLPPPQEKPDATMISVARAEVEMDLKPSTMDLDAYILGIYESIMKPYWPVPKSNFYCRICNYKEFQFQDELDRHNVSREHQRMEEAYKYAYCLYCQVHTTDLKNMKEHEATGKHNTVKELMERTKQCAIEHWHKVNKIALPQKYQRVEKEQVPIAPPVGSKRSAPDDDTKSLTSPLKKVSSSKPMEEKKIQHMGGGMQTRRKSSESGFKKVTPSKEVNLTDKEKLWFTPINGYMCAACHMFLKEGDLKNHTNDAAHAINIAKFKNLIK